MTRGGTETVFSILIMKIIFATIARCDSETYFANEIFIFRWAVD